MKPFLQLLRALCSATLLALVVCVLWGWLTREFGAQARWSEELARLLLVWLALLGAALAYAERAHLGIDLITLRFDPRTAAWAAVFGHAVTGLFAAFVLLGGGALLFWERWQSGQLLAALQIPKAWLYAPAPLCGLAMTVLAAAFAREAWPSAAPTDAKGGRA